MKSKLYDLVGDKVIEGKSMGQAVSELHSELTKIWEEYRSSGKLEKGNGVQEPKQEESFSIPWEVREKVNIAFQILAKLSHSIAVAKGWWKDGEEEERDFGEIMANFHSELSEAWEAHQKGITEDDKIPYFTGEEAELGDTFIRIFDYAAVKELRLADAVLQKMVFNANRPYRHGGKKA